ncbi:MAG: Ger(x)C family spore germination protein [Lutispora sp.]|nr:Ger(x)C family spore germination protein [Lutispora sp.]
MKKVYFLIILSVFFTGGCRAFDFGRAEINKILFINAIGIDKANDGSDDIVVTAVSKNIEATTGERDGSSESKTNANIFTSRGMTTFEAARNLSAYSDKKVFYGHVEYILIGESAAKDNILEYLDFFFRIFAARLNTKVLIVKDGSSHDIIKNMADEDIFIGDLLKSLLDEKKELSISDEIQIIQIMNMFDNIYMSPYIPCIEMKSYENDNPNEKKSKDRLQLAGFALFKEEKMFEYITDKMARGFNWIRGKVDSGVIVVKDPSGESISLKIIDARTKIIPKLSKGNLDVTIEVYFFTNVSDIKGTKDIFKKETLDYLEEQQENIIKKEIMEILSFAQKNNMDFFPISDEVYHKYPVFWEGIKDSWSEVFPKLKISVEAESVINRTYDIKEPIKSGYGVKE